MLRSFRFFSARKKNARHALAFCMRRQRLFLHLRWNGGRELERESSILARSMSFDMSRIDLSNRSLAENYLLRSNYLTDDLLSMIQTRAVQILFQPGFFFSFIFKFHSNSNHEEKKNFFLFQIRTMNNILNNFPVGKIFRNKGFEEIVLYIRCLSFIRQQLLNSTGNMVIYLV